MTFFWPIKMACFFQDSWEKKRRCDVTAYRTQNSWINFSCIRFTFAFFLITASANWQTSFAGYRCCVFKSFSFGLREAPLFKCMLVTGACCLHVVPVLLLSFCRASWLSSSCWNKPTLQVLWPNSQCWTFFLNLVNMCVVELYFSHLVKDSILIEK